MKRIAGVLFSLVMILTLSACGNRVPSENSKEIASVETEKSEKEQSMITQGTEERLSEPEETAQETENEETENEVTENEVTENEVTENRKTENDSSDKQEEDVSAKTLVVYFSCTGTTKNIAEYAAEISGADLYEIVPEEPYTAADLAYYTNGRADQEQNDPNVRPAISGGVENMDEYDTIILGYPIWHGQAPRIISTFLESYDFSGKTIVPFCTSHSSGIGSSADNLHALCSESVEWIDGRRFESGVSKEGVADWLGENGIE